MQIEIMSCQLPHHLLLIQEIADFHSQDKFHDFKIISDDDVTFSVHRLVIASYSEYFKALFATEMQEVANGSVKLHGVDGAPLKVLLDFCYSGQLSVNAANLKSVMKVAWFLQIRVAVDTCAAFVLDAFSLENCGEILELSDLCGIASLREKYFHVVATNFKQFVETEDYVEMTHGEAVELFRRDDLKVDNETQIFKAIQKWLDHDVQNREPEIHKLFELCRMSTDGWLLIDAVAQLELFQRNDFCKEILDFHISYMADWKTRHLKQGERTRVRSTENSLVILGGESPRVPSLPFASVGYVENLENHYYDKTSNTWRDLGQTSNIKAVIGVQMVNVNGFGIYCGGLERVSSAESGVSAIDNAGMPPESRQQQHRCTAETRLLSPFNFQTLSLTPMAYARVAFALVSTGKYLYAMGGYTNGDLAGQYLPTKSCERYVIAENRWESAPPLPVELVCLSGAYVNGFIYVFGGAVGLDVDEPRVQMSGVWALDVQKGEWEEKGAMPQSRKYEGWVHHGCVVWRGRVYVIGGMRHMNRGNSVSDVDVYDPDSDLWTPFAGLLIAVRSFNCAVLDDTIYVAGGVNDSNTIIDVVQFYDKKTGKWEMMKPRLPKALARFGILACRLKLPVSVEEDQRVDLRNLQL